MFAPPVVETIAWDQCVVRMDTTALSDLDRRLMRKATRKVSRLTSIRFRRGSGNPIPGIRVWYNHQPAGYVIAQTATQSDTRGRIYWAGIQLHQAYWDAPRRVRVLKHELLHAVGIGHTGGKRSIMYGVDMPGQRILPGLRDKLRTRYAHCHRER
jgi:hypothetical protein